MRQEHETMELPNRAQRREWNLNTIIHLVTLLEMCVGGVAIWVEKSRDLEELQNRRAETKSFSAGSNPRCERPRISPIA